MGLGSFPQAAPYAKSCSLCKAAGLPWSRTGTLTSFALLSNHGAELIMSENKQTVSQAFGKWLRKVSLFLMMYNHENIKDICTRSLDSLKQRCRKLASSLSLSLHFPPVSHLLYRPLETPGYTCTVFAVLFRTEGMCLHIGDKKLHWALEPHLLSSCPSSSVCGFCDLGQITEAFRSYFSFLMG